MNRIKDLREALGLTQEMFSKKIGLARNTIANYECGRREPTNQVITSICREYSVNETWLRTGKGEMFIEKTPNQAITDFLEDVILDDNSFKKRLIEALAKLDVEDWEALAKIAEKLTKKG